MAVTQIGIEDTIGGAIARFGEAAGKALDKTVFAKGLREKEFRKVPESMQALLPGVRAAVARGPEAVVAMAKGLGVNPEFLTDEIMAGFTPTSQQAVEEAFLKGGGAEATAFSGIQKSLLDGRTAEEALKAQIPVLQASATAKGLEFDADNFEVQIEGLNFQVENGVILTKLETDKAQSELELATIQGTTEIFKSFNQNTAQGRHDALVFNFGMNNQAALTHLGLHEQLSFQEQLAIMRAEKSDAQTTAEKIDLTLDLETAWNTAVDRLKEADEAGDDDFLRIAVDDVNTVRLMIAEAKQGGVIFQIDTSPASLGKKFFGGVKLELAETIFEDPRAAAFVAEAEAQGITDITELGRIGIDGQSVESGEPSVLDSLSPRVREQVVTNFPLFMEQVAALNEGTELGILSKGSRGRAALESAVLEQERISGEDIPRGQVFDTLARGFNFLSEGLQSAVNAGKQPVRSP